MPPGSVSEVDPAVSARLVRLVAARSVPRHNPVRAGLRQYVGPRSALSLVGRHAGGREVTDEMGHTSPGAALGNHLAGILRVPTIAASPRKSNCCFCSISSTVTSDFTASSAPGRPEASANHLTYCSVLVCESLFRVLADPQGSSMNRRQQFGTGTCRPEGLNRTCGE